MRTLHPEAGQLHRRRGGSAGDPDRVRVDGPEWLPPFQIATAATGSAASPNAPALISGPRSRMWARPRHVPNYTPDLIALCWRLQRDSRLPLNTRLLRATPGCLVVRFDRTDAAGHNGSAAIGADLCVKSRGRG